MSIIDILIICIFAISIIFGILKGLIRQVFGMVAVILGILLAIKFYPVLAEKLPLSNPSVSNILSFIIIFIAVAVVIILVGIVAQKFVHFVALGWIDRVTGGILGCIIGLLINWVICVMIGTFTPNGENIIGKSTFGADILRAGSVFTPLFPDKIKKQIKKLGKFTPRKKGL